MMVTAVSKFLVTGFAAGLTGLAAILALDPRDQPPFPEPELQSVKMPDGSAVLLSRFEVTRGQWRACYEAGGCSFSPTKASQPSDQSFPVTGVSYLDVQEFITWINRASGHSYRLPTAEEWKIAASELPVFSYRKLFSDPRLAWAADYGAMPNVPKAVQPSGHFGTLANGIADLGGNVWEWTSSCVVKAEASRCPAFFAEGLHETKLSVFIREPAIGGCTAGVPPPNIGFRLVLDDTLRS